MQHFCSSCGDKKYRSSKDNLLRCRKCNYAKSRAWKLANKERVKEHGMLDFRRHRVARLQYAKKRYDGIRQDPTAWAKHLQLRRNRPRDGAKRRIAKRLLWIKAGNVKSCQLIALYQNAGGLCAYCGVKVKPRFDACDPRGFDHVIAMANGGKHTISNIVVCCLSCNTKKGQKPASFMSKLKQAL